MQSLQADDQMPMIIVVGDTLDPEQIKHLETLVGGRQTAIATEAYEDAPEALDRLYLLFPNAKALESKSEETVEDVHNPTDDTEYFELFDDEPSL